MEIEEILARRGEVRYILNHLPFYPTVDFLVRPTKPPTPKIIPKKSKEKWAGLKKFLENKEADNNNYVYLPRNRGVRSYRTLSQNTGLLVDIPLSYKTTSENPYTQGMFIVYDTDLSFPYPYFAYPQEGEEGEDTDKRALSESYVVPPEENIHTVTTGYLTFTLGDVVNLLQVCAMMAEDDKSEDAMGGVLWIVGDPNSTYHKVEIQLIKDPNEALDSGMFYLMAQWMESKSSGDAVILCAINLANENMFSMAENKTGAWGVQTNIYPVGYEWTNVGPNELIMGAKFSIRFDEESLNNIYAIPAESPFLRIGLEEPDILAIFTPSISVPPTPPPDPTPDPDPDPDPEIPDVVTDLVFVRPAGIIGREAETWDLTQYNKVYPLTRGGDMDNLPMTGFEVPYEEEYTIPPDTNKHTYSPLNAIGFKIKGSAIEQVVSACFQYAISLENIPQYVIFWQLEDLNFDPMLRIAQLALAIVKGSPKIDEPDPEPFNPYGDYTVHIGVRILRYPDMSEDSQKRWVMAPLISYAITLSEENGLSMNLFRGDSISGDVEAIGINYQINYSNPSWNVPDTENSIGDDAEVIIVSRLLDTTTEEEMSLWFYQVALTRTELFTEPDILSIFPFFSPEIPDPTEDWPQSWGESMLVINPSWEAVFEMFNRVRGSEHEEEIIYSIANPDFPNFSAVLVLEKYLDTADGVMSVSLRFQSDWNTGHSTIFTFFPDEDYLSASKNFVEPVEIAENVYMLVNWTRTRTEESAYETRLTVQIGGEGFDFHKSTIDICHDSVFGLTEEEYQVIFPMSFEGTVKMETEFI